MNDTSRFESLADEDLEQVAAGKVNCGGLADGYTAIGDVMNAVGLKLQAVGWWGRALGVLDVC